DANLAASLQRLKVGGDQFGEEDRATLLEGLAEAQYVLGNRDEARQLWQEMTQLPSHQNDLRLRLMLFDLAIMGEDEPGMNKLLDDIRNIERSQGSFYHLGLALKQIWRARKGKGEHKAELVEARLQLDQVRMPWPRVSLARAE